MAISKLAVIAPDAELADDVDVGPFCYIGPGVVIDAGTVLHPHVTVVGRTRVGRNNIIHPHACVGTPPQDKTYADEPTGVEVGDDNVIRECVTIHRGSTKEEGVTRVGSGCYLMACSHVAHDCVVGDEVIFGNNVLVGGHVHVEDGANVNGGAAVHPFATIGRLAYVGGLTRIVQDVPPFMIVEGHPSRVRGINSVGLRRAGVSPDVIGFIAKAYRRIYRRGRPRAEVLEEMENENGWPDEVRHLCAALRHSAAGRSGRYRETLRRRPSA
ncbi:MAG: acyl-ACP--UDP-N-acetylglucosamine O-acyltransferase [Planctomycetes bacterium]|nr:acyl-ACP--UDP-N-acetylglucosamine O-acyltransferase [Planctomycetota bacterium]